jgi:hypothetical protein
MGSESRRRQAREIYLQELRRAIKEIDKHLVLPHLPTTEFDPESFVDRAKAFHCAMARDREKGGGPEWASSPGEGCSPGALASRNSRATLDRSRSDIRVVDRSRGVVRRGESDSD